MYKRQPLLRAAAIGSGAYYDGKRRIEAHEREMREQARVAEIEQLAALREQGALSGAEFEARKAKLLGG